MRCVARNYSYWTQLLYKTQVVWPTNAPPDIANSKAAYTINAGQYDYPFQFKVGQPRLATLFKS